MKAAVIRKHGEADVLEYLEWPDPEPGQGAAQNQTIHGTFNRPMEQAEHFWKIGSVQFSLGRAGFALVTSGMW